MTAKKTAATKEEGIIDVWDRFERWQRRYRKLSYDIIATSIENGYFDDGSVFVDIHAELGSDPAESYSEETLRSRIDARIAFFRGYLVDISFDQAGFMSKKSRIFPLQYQSRCDQVLGIWLEQDPEGECRPGGYLGFQGMDVSFFVNQIEDVDLASVWNILPFDSMHLRHPGGTDWTKPEVDKVISSVDEDLSFDLEYRMKTRRAGMMLHFDFKWK